MKFERKVRDALHCERGIGEMGEALHGYPSLHRTNTRQWFPSQKGGAIVASWIAHQWIVIPRCAVERWNHVLMRAAPYITFQTDCGS